LATSTGKPKDQIHKDIDRDFYMSAGQAKEYGIIDDVLVPKRPKTTKDDKDK
jgi:ATP-dependent Clp protease protease subunit